MPWRSILTNEEASHIRRWRNVVKIERFFIFLFHNTTIIVIIVQASLSLEVARMESARQMEVARIESAKQSDRLFMTMMITLMNPRKAEESSLAEIQYY